MQLKLLYQSIPLRSSKATAKKQQRSNKAATKQQPQSNRKEAQ